MDLTLICAPWGVGIARHATSEGSQRRAKPPPTTVHMAGGWDLALETAGSNRRPDLGAPRPRGQVDRLAELRELLRERETRVVLDPVPVAHDDPRRPAQLIVRATADNPAAHPPSAKFPDGAARLETPLVERADDVLAQLKAAQARLHLVMQSIPLPDPRREAQRLQFAEPAARQGRPGIASADTVIDHPLRVGGLLQSAVETSKAIGLGLAPDAALRFGPGQIAQPLVGDFLGPSPEAVAHVVPGNYEVAAIGLAAPHDDVGMRLVGVEVAGPHPGQVRPAALRAHPAHDLARLVAKVGDPVAVLRRNDETEVVAGGAPAVRDLRSVDAVLGAVEELRTLPGGPGAGAAEIGQVLAQGLAAQGALSGVPGDQTLDDDALAHIQTEGTA